MKAAEKEARRAFLGASDFAAILGLDPWKKPIDIFMAKTGEKPAEDDSEEGPAAWGRFLERVVIQRWMLGHPELPLTYAGRRTRSFTHPEHPFIAATPDAYYRAPVKGRRRTFGPVEYVVEAKTSRFGKGFGEQGTDEIPRGYKVQAIVQSAVTGAPIVYMPVLIAGSEPREYVVEPTDAQREAVIAAGVEFWTEHVQTGIPPDEISEEYARQRWPDDSGEELVATDADVEMVKAYRMARQNREATEQAEDAAKLEIMARMGDFSRFLGSGFSISWKKTKDVEKTDWPLFADSLRKIIEGVRAGAIVHVEKHGNLATFDGGAVLTKKEVDLLFSNLETLRSIYTSTRPGSRVFRPTFDEEE